MIILRPVLVVKEMPPCLRKLRSHYPSMKGLVSETPQPYEENIVGYMRQGIYCEVFRDRGLMFDSFTTSDRIPRLEVDAPGRALKRPLSFPLDPDSGRCLIQPNELLTDGAWIWAAALIYYVEHYHLRLNPEFISYARNHDWTIDAAGIASMEFDTSEFYRYDESFPTTREQTDQ